MFSLFSKKFMNEAAARTFWAWFEEQELWIINCLSNHDSAFVWAIDERLKPVFPYFKKEPRKAGSHIVTAGASPRPTAHSIITQIGRENKFSAEFYVSRTVEDAGPYKL